MRYISDSENISCRDRVLDILERQDFENRDCVLIGVHYDAQQFCSGHNCYYCETAKCDLVDEILWRSLYAVFFERYEYDDVRGVDVACVYINAIIDGELMMFEIHAIL